MEGKNLLQQLWDAVEEDDHAATAAAAPMLADPIVKDAAQEPPFPLRPERSSEPSIRPRMASLTVSRESDGLHSPPGESLRNSMLTRSLDRNEAFRLVRHGSDSHTNDEYYFKQMEIGNFVKMGWLTKEGHMWKNWKTRFFVLFSDGMFAYYKSKGKKKIKGCVKLNEGIVSIQHVDVRKAGKAYVFQVEKGFYRLLCYCCSQLEAELWVNALRGVRKTPPPCYEIDLTAQEEKQGTIAVTRHLNKIFIKDKRIADLVEDFKSTSTNGNFRLDTIQTFIEKLEGAVIDRHHMELYKDREIELMPGNELVKLIRRHVEDRIFVPLHGIIYAGLDSNQVRLARSTVQRNVKALRSKPQTYFGVPQDLAMNEWTQAIEIINTIDCASIPSHKIEVIVAAGKEIVQTVAVVRGTRFEVASDVMMSVFRYVVAASTLDDIVILRALLKQTTQLHPACQHKTQIVDAFIEAIKWIETYQIADNGDHSEELSLEASRRTVSISTRDVGTQFCTDGSGRGAVVYSIRRQSQAALSSSIEPGLVLIAVNDEPVILTPLKTACRVIKEACLPKRLTFLSEFYYYQLLSLDTDMYLYLMCVAAARGDTDSAAHLFPSVDLNELCMWEKTRGKQVFGFKPISSKGSPLHAAAYYGQHVMIDYLLSMGASPDIRNHKGRTPLHLVSTSIDMVMVIERLMKGGADVNAVDRRGMTPLMFMCTKGSIEGVTTLLAIGADVRRSAWSNGFTALHFCVEQRDFELVDMLLSKGADPNASSTNGETCLHLACMITDSAVVLRLAQANADPNIQNRFGQTPLSVLLSEARRDATAEEVRLCAEILITAGARLDHRDLLGRNVRHLTAISRYSGLKRLFNQLPARGKNREADDLDVFGCLAADYERSDRDDVAQLQTQLPTNCFRIGDGQRRVKSCTLGELVGALLNDVQIDIIDVISFVLFLDTFSSINEVLTQISFRASHGRKGRGVLRLVVLMLLFKHDIASSADNSLTSVHEILERQWGILKQQALSLVDEYRDIYQRYFALQATPQVQLEYKRIADELTQRYQPSAPTLDAAFPRSFYCHTDPLTWSQHCTILCHALFCSIPVNDFLQTEKKKEHSVVFTAAKKWFQHLSAYVINTVLLQDSMQARAEAVSFYLAAADYCASLHNYDTLAAILYALQSTAVQRLRKTLDCLSVSSKKLLNQMQFLSDKGCREMNRIMRNSPNPSMPYLGLYLQNFVGLNELPVFEKADMINCNRLRKMGELALEILHRKSVAYALQFNENIDCLLHVKLPYDTEESRYNRSLELEPRDSAAVPLSDRSSCVTVEDLDIDNEVRESIGCDNGTIGFRQWFRMQKVVHRNRSRSSAQQQYEWA
ncbi:TPA: hypothetical protein N0F65_001798 [Lagenidium giganteum]|uniref:Uncharacterized protein n=1 Tax=Lagenidium giganteum TaxID=4803 RepID=A0AAV2Z7K4_9STRA|nr:TPA: hypothetical protein N0F65_001798 [Lagenidium giganteum]